MFITIALSIALVAFVLGLILLAFYNLTKNESYRYIAGVFTAGCGIVIAACLGVVGVNALANMDNQLDDGQVCANEGKIYHDYTCYTIDQYKVIKGEE